MFGWFSQDTKEIAEALVILVLTCVGELKTKGSDSLRTEIDKNLGGKCLPPERSRVGVEVTFFDGTGILQEFSFRIEDERKIDGSGISLIAEGDQRYFGFLLWCDLATGRVTVDAPKYISKDSTREARKLCKEFASKYAKATSGRFV